MIHVLSYNLLADRLAHASRYPHIPRSILAFNYRGPRIVAEIRESEADILCLQEVDHVSDFYAKELDKIGYSLV